MVKSTCRKLNFNTTTKMKKMHARPKYFKCPHNHILHYYYTIIVHINTFLQDMSSGSDDFRSSPNMMPSSTMMLAGNNSSANDNNMNGVNGCEGLVVVKQEQQDYKSVSSTCNYTGNNAADGCNMLQKVPSLSDLSDPENSLGT